MRKFLLILLILGLASPSWAAVKFIESGSDATFDLRMWTTDNGNCSVESTIVHTGPKSLKCGTGAAAGNVSRSNAVQDSGTRCSFWMYLPSIPAAATFFALMDDGASTSIRLRVETNGTTSVVVTTGTVTGSTVISAATWTQYSFAYTINNSTDNEIRYWINGVSEASITDATLNSTATNRISLRTSTAAAVAYFDDIICDDSSALTNIGAGGLRVTAKRPIANGTANQFTTEVGTGPAPDGASGCAGHSCNVSERPASASFGWQIFNAGGVVLTEEYSIQSASAGDVNLTGATIVGLGGWIFGQSSDASTPSIMLAGSSAGTLSFGAGVLLVYQKFSATGTYPAGNTDIGLVSDTTVTTFVVYEAGINVAYIPAAAATGCKALMLGVC